MKAFLLVQSKTKYESIYNNFCLSLQKRNRQKNHVAVVNAEPTAGNAVTNANVVPSGLRYDRQCSQFLQTLCTDQPSFNLN